MRGLTSVPACAAFKTSIAWFCSALPESVHAFRSSADFAPVRTRSPRSSPAPREVPSSALVLSSSFCALSLSSSALLLPTKLKMPKTSRMTATTANTIVVMRNTFVPPRFGGAPPGVGGGPGGGPGGGAKGGGPAGGGLGVVGGGCGGVVAMRSLPSCRVVRGGLSHTLGDANACPRVRCAQYGGRGQRSCRGGRDGSGHRARRRAAVAPFAQLASRAPHEQSACRTRRPRVALARSDAGVGAPH